MAGSQAAWIARLDQVSLRYGASIALDQLSLEIPAGCMVGLIGPDGVGKSSLLALVTGARAVQQGRIHVMGGSMANAGHRNRVCPRIAYMPQGLGKNLYATLSVEENLQFFARLFGHGKSERRRRIDALTRSTGLYPFLSRPAGKLSGGMKQKLGLCCALIHDPDFLVLDEPTTGVDPLARRQFWELIDRIRTERPTMSVLVATAYMDEAQGFDWLIAMDAGRVLARGTPQAILAQTGTAHLEQAFIGLLPPEKRRGHKAVIIPTLVIDDNDIAIEAEGLTMRFGAFVAVDDVSFRIRRGEIFGFLGSNGCGKTTTMKMLTGLLPASEGKARLFGQEVNPDDIDTRRRVGYMSQSFSLYRELTVRQNLVLHARLFHVPAERLDERVAEMMARFNLTALSDRLPAALPLGVRQRLSLAVAMVHKPELLILDEPTSGVDPIARDEFWHFLIELSRKDKVTIFMSTHFMNEAARCDRMSMMHAGKVLDSDTPSNLMKKRGVNTLEDAFVGYLLEAGAGEENDAEQKTDAVHAGRPTDSPTSADGHGSPKNRPRRGFSLQRLLSYSWRESLELQRDPIRAALALAGSLVLLFVIGFGITMDVEDVRYAVLDRDQTTISQDYALQMAGSRYFVEQAPLRDDADMDRRLRRGEIALAIEIPAGYGRSVLRGQGAAIGAWVDGSMPQRAETIQGYLQGIHHHWLASRAKTEPGIDATPRFTLQDRYRYNPDVKSMPAMVPAIIPMLLLMLPAMLTALAIVREKELGSIINFYVTPVSRAEFLLGKQLPYFALAMVNFLCMALLAVTVFGVPLKGSTPALLLATALFCLVSTGMGLLASAITRSQIAAMFITIIGTMLPTVQFAGLLNPVSSMEGPGRFIGRIYPATHMFDVSRGVFNKGLQFADLHTALWPLAAAIPVIFAAALVLLPKQER